MQYRRDIDGLRAVAVLPVILFHAGFDGFKHGYVGVDIFFVISGYLITTLIVREIANDSFSLISFYDRRARRILPALFLVMAVSIPLSAWVMEPNDLNDFARSLVAVPLFYSNIFFWNQTGYFGGAANFKPLLHTWSLAVEEQFYILFPLAFTLIWRWGRKLVLAALILCLATSVLLAWWGGINKPNAAFFLLPTRAWEILCGAVIAMILSRRQKQWSHAASQVLSLVGLGFILVGLVVQLDSPAVPNLQPVPAVVGTAMLILFARPETYTGKILSSKPLVAIGLISYSAYLWHQPLFAFARHGTLDEPTSAAFAGLSIATLLLGAASWRYVERPFRRKDFIPRQAFAWFAVGGSLALIGIGLGWSAVLSKSLPLTMESTEGKCNFDRQRCYEIQGKGVVRVALWGDSYADAFSQSLGPMLNRSNISLTLFVKTSCPSIPNTNRDQNNKAGQQFIADCTGHNNQALAEIKSAHFDYLILTSAYEWYLNGKNEQGRPIIADIENPALPPANFIPKRIAALVDLANKAGTKVIVITPHPRATNFREILKSSRHRTSVDQQFDIDGARLARDTLIRGLQEAQVNFTEIDGMGLYCQKQDCNIIGRDGKILLYDGAHISGALAKTLSEHIATTIITRR